MSIVANRLRKSLRTIQIIMIGGSLVGTTMASELEGSGDGEGRDSLKFSCLGADQQNDSGSLTTSGNVFENDSVSLKSSGNVIEMDDANNLGDENIDFGLILKSSNLVLLESSHLDKELSQPSNIRVLRTLQEENNKLKEEHAKMMGLLENAIQQHAEVKLSLDKIVNEREDYKAQLEQVTKRNTGLVTRDKQRTFNINIAYGVTSLFAIMYVLYEMIYYPSPYNAEKIDL